jgi:prepilin-type N-terminal cleavage/methylation domain-containing protein
MPMKLAKRRSGFTLIELLIAVSIISIISAIGFATYSTAQVFARDTKRKTDLHSISAALQLYYRDNKRYPYSEWFNSTRTPSPWIAELNQNYINVLPTDPKNTGCNNNTFDLYNVNCYTYEYYSGVWNSLNNPNPPYGTNQGFILVTRLENKQDPDSGKSAPTGSGSIVCWPSGEGGQCPTRITTGWSADTYVIGNNN